MATKELIRKCILRVRNEIISNNQKEWSRQIGERLFAMDVYQNANVIYFYYAFGSEVLTQEMIEAALMQGKRVALPRVHGDAMTFCEIHDFKQLTSGVYGIMEPTGDEPIDAPPDVVVMPGVAFDEKKNRIGYGRGYYDRFLSNSPETATIALAFECQIFGPIPASPLDKRPDWIITEYRVI